MIYTNIVEVVIPTGAGPNYFALPAPRMGYIAGITVAEDSDTPASAGAVRLFCDQDRMDESAGSETIDEDGQPSKYSDGTYKAVPDMELADGSARLSMVLGLSSAVRIPYRIDDDHRVEDSDWLVMDITHDQPGDVTYGVTILVVSFEVD